MTEVMIVVVIIGLLAAMAIPAYQKVRDRNNDYSQAEVVVERRPYYTDSRNSSRKNRGGEWLWFAGGLVSGMGFQAVFSHLARVKREKKAYKNLRNRW